MKLIIKYFGVIALLLSAGLIFYFIHFRDQILFWFAGQSDPTLEWITNTFYPRLLVDKYRYSGETLVFYADQLVIRISLFIILLLFITYRWRKKKNLFFNWNSFWSGEISYNYFKGLNLFFYGIVAWLGFDMLSDLINLHQIKPLYKPVSFLWLFDIPYPYLIFIYFYVITLVIFCIAIAIGFRSIFLSLYIMLIFIVLEAFTFSFEKTDHHLSTVTYALLIMPLLHFFLTKEKKISIWPIKLIQLSIGLSYLLSAIEKISISGIFWPQQSFCGYLSLYSVSNDYCTLLGYGLLFFQLTFIFIVFYPKLRWMYLPAGLIFHTATYYLAGIGGWLHPWWLMYLFFIDWSFIGKYLPDKWPIQRSMVQ